MQIKSKYKIARRLGSFLFEKTQTAKFALRSERKAKNSKKSPRGRAKGDFGLQLLEKQKARFMYGIGERQFSRYVNEVLTKHGVNQDVLLYERLERRLDNAVYRLGFAPTRLASRQMVSHGHILVNGNKTTVPSYELSLDDKITIREGSKKKKIFETLLDRVKETQTPSWLSFDMNKSEAKVVGVPKLKPTETPFDLPLILEFYKR